MPLDTIFGTMQAALGSAYVNDFNKFGKTYQVRVQADQQFRLHPEDIGRLEVRNREGRMIPLGTLATIRKTLGPQIVPVTTCFLPRRLTGRRLRASVRDRPCN